MINVDHFRTEIVRPTLEAAMLWSPAAENLLVGTAIQESGLRYLRQLEDGPALGVYQIEPATHADLWENYLSYRSELSHRVNWFLADLPSAEEQLVTNLAYATMIARLVYYRRPEPLPDADDIDGLATYYKQHFNTPLGKATPAEWALKYREFAQ